MYSLSLHKHLLGQCGDSCITYSLVTGRFCTDWIESLRINSESVLNQFGSVLLLDATLHKIYSLSLHKHLLRQCEGGSHGGSHLVSQEVIEDYHRNNVYSAFTSRQIIYSYDFHKSITTSPRSQHILIWHLIYCYENMADVEYYSILI